MDAANNANIELLEQEAEDHYRLGQYHQAVEKYNILIERNPNDAIAYARRGSCYEKMENFTTALQDSKRSIELDPTLISGHCQVIRCALRLHQLLDMNRSVEKLREIDPNNEVLSSEVNKMHELERHLANLKNARAAKNDVRVLKHLEECLKICPGLIQYKVKKAECLTSLRSFNEATALANEILQQHPDNSEAHFILGRCLYETDIERSVHHYEESFRLNPLCDYDREFYMKAKDFLRGTAVANNAYNSQNFAEAHKLYRSVLTDSFNFKNKDMMTTLLSNMAEASYKLGENDRCLQECATLLNRQPNHPKALIRRAQCQIDQGNYAEAIENLETALTIAPSDEVVRMLENARRLFVLQRVV